MKKTGMFTRIAFAIFSAIPVLISLAFWGLLLQLESIFSRKSKSESKETADVAPAQAAPSPARQRYSETLQSLHVPADTGTKESSFRGWVVHRAARYPAMSPTEISAALHPPTKATSMENSRARLSLVTPASIRSNVLSEAPEALSNRDKHPTA